VNEGPRRHPFTSPLKEGECTALIQTYYTVMSKFMESMHVLVQWDGNVDHGLDFRGLD
jgi:hypothetical protein